MPDDFNRDDAEQWLFEKSLLDKDLAEIDRRAHQANDKVVLAYIIQVRASLHPMNIEALRAASAALRAGVFADSALKREMQRQRLIASSEIIMRGRQTGQKAATQKRTQRAEDEHNALRKKAAALRRETFSKTKSRHPGQVEPSQSRHDSKNYLAVQIVGSDAQRQCQESSTPPHVDGRNALATWEHGSPCSSLLPLRRESSTNQRILSGRVSDGASCLRSGHRRACVCSIRRWSPSSPRSVASAHSTNRRRPNASNRCRACPRRRTHCGDRA